MDAGQIALMTGAPLSLPEHDWLRPHFLPLFEFTLDGPGDCGLQRLRFAVAMVSERSHSGFRSDTIEKNAISTRPLHARRGDQFGFWIQWIIFCGGNLNDFGRIPSIESC